MHIKPCRNVVKMDNKHRYLVDVIIPVYKPGKRFARLLQMLETQTYPVNKIIVMNTDEGYWNKKGYDGIENLEVHHVKKTEFDHGKTRNTAAGFAKGDIMVFMTDDSVPTDNSLIEHLVKGFGKKGPFAEQAAVVYGRQMPAPDCKAVERYTRSFNYPARSQVKTKKDLPALGIKTYFASNACCAYDRSVFNRLGGFVDRAIFNEDMIYASKAIQAGYAVVYEADARVEHSHNYTCLQQFHRNFDLGVSQADHPEVFADIKSEGEGIRLVKQAMRYFIRQKKPCYIVPLIFGSGFKYLGYFMGKRYQRLPKRAVYWCSMNRTYWDKGGDSI